MKIHKRYSVVIAAHNKRGDKSIFMIERGGWRNFIEQKTRRRWKTRRIKGAEEIRERRFLAPGRNIILFYGAFRFSLRLCESSKNPTTKYLQPPLLSPSWRLISALWRWRVDPGDSTAAKYPIGKRNFFISLTNFDAGPLLPLPALWPPLPSRPSVCPLPKLQGAFF